jgi:hypothetical protein
MVQKESHTHVMLPNLQDIRELINLYFMHDDLKKLVLYAEFDYQIAWWVKLIIGILRKLM